MTHSIPTFSSHLASSLPPPQEVWVTTNHPAFQDQGQGVRSFSWSLCPYFSLSYWFGWIFIPKALQRLSWSLGHGRLGTTMVPFPGPWVLSWQAAAAAATEVETRVRSFHPRTSHCCQNLAKPKGVAYQGWAGGRAFRGLSFRRFHIWWVLFVLIGRSVVNINANSSLLFFFFIIIKVISLSMESLTILKSTMKIKSTCNDSTQR